MSRSPITIVIFFSDNPCLSGGNQTWLRETVRLLAEYDHVSLHVLAPCLPPSEVRACAAVHIFDSRNIMSRATMAPSPTRLARAVVRILPDIAPDAVLSNQGAAIVASKMCLPRSQRIFLPGSLRLMDVLMDIRTSSAALPLRLRHFLHLPFVWLSEARALKSASSIVVNTRFLQHSICKCYGQRLSGKIGIVPMGINLQRFQLLTRQRKDDSSKRVILSVFRLNPSKNAMRILDVVPLLEDTYEWWIAGDGRQKGELESEIHRRGLQGRVILLGERQDINLLCSQADIFVHLSLHENYGLVILEALASGLKIVALDPQQRHVFTGIGELLSGDEGVLVPDEPTLISDAIRALTVSPRDRVEVERTRRRLCHSNHVTSLLSLVQTKRPGTASKEITCVLR